MKLSREFYNRDALTVSEEILGKTLVHMTEEGITRGKIVEVEAYIGPQDKASHAYKKICARTVQGFNMEREGTHIFI